MTTEPQVKPMPTLAEIAERLRDRAAWFDVLAEGERGGGDPATATDLATQAAWHEAAARQIDALAAQGREVAQGREALALLLREVELSGNAEAKDYGWPRAVSAARTALAAPPADQPREHMITVADMLADQAEHSTLPDSDHLRGKSQ
jgi:hypothetical protein